MIIELKTLLQNFRIIYIVISPTARTDGKIPVKGYAGPTGRLDEIARDILSLRNKGSLLIASLLGPPNPPKTLFYQSRTCSLVSERQVITEIKKAFDSKSTCVRILPLPPEDLLAIVRKLGYRVVLLTETGSGKIPIHANKIAYLMGSHIDVPDELLNVLVKYVEIKASIGPLSYQTSQVIAYLEWEAERCRRAR